MISNAQWRTSAVAECTPAGIRARKVGPFPRSVRAPARPAQRLRDTGHKCLRQVRGRPQDRSVRRTCCGEPPTSTKVSEVRGKARRNQKCLRLQPDSKGCNRKTAHPNGEDRLFSVLHKDKSHNTRSTQPCTARAQALSTLLLPTLPSPALSLANSVPPSHHTRQLFLVTRGASSLGPGFVPQFSTVGYVVLLRSPMQMTEEVVVLLTIDAGGFVSGADAELKKAVSSGMLFGGHSSSRDVPVPQSEELVHTPKIPAVLVPQKVLYTNSGPRSDRKLRKYPARSARTFRTCCRSRGRELEHYG